MAMPIRRPNENDPDWMAKKQDKELIYLEERISALYEEASHDVTEEYERFWESYQLEYDNRLAMVESGELSDDAFQNWCRHQIFRGDRYRALIRELTDVLTNADVAAMAAVNEQLPYTLAESYDFISSLGFEAADQAGISMGTFQIYNADSVREIIRQNPSLFPVVDLPEDEAWNRRHINNEIMQAIIQGDSMQQVARRLQSVAAMDNRAAIRNARTAMTAAENLGRSESARRLKQKGLPVKEVWSATKDSRTRNTHLLLDGTEKDNNGYYGADILRVPLRFPADPNGEPQEIYNCRCRDNVVIAGLDHSRDDELYENFMRENYPEDWQALQQREAESGKADERRQALERQRRLREERASQAQANAQPTYRTATNRAEAIEILNELGFGKISSGVRKLDEEMLVSNVNKLSELNSKFHAITQGMDLATGKMRACAYVAHQYNTVGNKTLKLSTSWFSDREGAIMTTRRCVESRWWMPIASGEEINATLAHEYGHMLQNSMIITPEFVSGFNAVRPHTREYIIDNFEVVRIRHRREIIDIARANNPNFDLFANISEYGRKNNAEFFAECFMNSQCGSPNELGLAMQEWLRRQGYDT